MNHMSWPLYFHSFYNKNNIEKEGYSCFCDVYKENKGNDDKPPGQRYLVNYFGYKNKNTSYEN